MAVWAVLPTACKGDYPGNISLTREGRGTGISTRKSEPMYLSPWFPLSKIKRGERLNYAHEAHFNAMLNELVMLSDRYKMSMDDDRHREVIDFMLDILLMEHGFVRNRSPALKP